MSRQAAALLVLISGMGVASSSVAADKPGRNVVRFDGDTIDGDLQRPDGDLMAARPRPAMPSLVEPPRSFERASWRTLMSAAAALVPQSEDREVIQDGKEGTDVGRGAGTSGGTR